jgi:uncharacterized protein (DUF2147 family)
VSTAAAQAQYTFDYGGRTIRIDPDRGTVSIPGVYDNTGRHGRRAKSEESERKRKPAQAQEAKTDPQAAPSTSPATAPAPTAAPTDQVAAPVVSPPTAPAASSATGAAEPTSTSLAVAPSATTPTVSPLPPAPRPAQQEATPAAAPAPAVAALPPPPPPPRPVANAAQAANSPLGVWMTEEKEGKVRIEQCGANLCGYAVDKKSNENGEQVLINMKPAKEKWSGRILDPNTGSTYDSTIVLKGPDTLRVQGCAFGGMFCGGQTWTRAN